MEVVDLRLIIGDDGMDELPWEIHIINSSRAVANAEKREPVCGMMAKFTTGE